MKKQQHSSPTPPSPTGYWNISYFFDADPEVTLTKSVAADTEEDALRRFEYLQEDGARVISCLPVPQPYWRVCFVEETSPDDLLEYIVIAQNSREAYETFWKHHDNPHLTIISCMRTKPNVDELINLEVRLEQEIKAGINSFQEFLRNGPTEEHPNWSRFEDYKFPSIITIEDDFLIRAVYALAAIYIRHDISELARYSQALHLVNTHAIRYVAECGEPLTGTGDTSDFTYVRDAATLFDFLQNGSNSVWIESDLFKTVDAIMPELKG